MSACYYHASEPRLYKQICLAFKDHRVAFRWGNPTSQSYLCGNSAAACTVHDSSRVVVLVISTGDNKHW